MKSNVELDPGQQRVLPYVAEAPRSLSLQPYLSLSRCLVVCSPCMALRMAYTVYRICKGLTSIALKGLTASDVAGGGWGAWPNEG